MKASFRTVRIARVDLNHAGRVYANYCEKGHRKALQKTQAKKATWMQCPGCGPATPSKTPPAARKVPSAPAPENAWGAGKPPTISSCAESPRAAVVPADWMEGVEKRIVAIEEALRANPWYEAGNEDPMRSRTGARKIGAVVRKARVLEEVQPVLDAVVFLLRASSEDRVEAEQRLRTEASLAGLLS